jgi:hypothetical protein
MNRHFRTDRLPDVRSFYEGAIGKLTRERRGYALGNCPFHVSKSKHSFSVNLTRGAFHCFGCAAHGGGIVGFVMLRDHLNFKEACQSLGCWDSSPSSATIAKLESQARERERQRDQAAADKEADRRRRISIRDQLHAANWAYKIINERLSQLLQGATPDWPSEQEDCWASLALTNGDRRRLDRDYCSAAGLEYAE